MSIIDTHPGHQTTNKLVRMKNDSHRMRDRDRQAEEPIELYYWKISGRASPIRMLLHYLKAPYVEKNPRTLEDWSDWSEKAQKSGLYFSNLPFIADGSFKISESDAIPWYIAKKFNRSDLVGKTVEDEAYIRQIEGVITDLNLELLTPVFHPRYKEALIKAQEVGAKCDQFLSKLSRYLGDKQFLMGYFTITDILLAYSYYMFAGVFSSCELPNPFDRYPNLVQHRKVVRAIPGIKEYCDWEEENLPILHQEKLPWLRVKKGV